jgi:hypothetical protein
VVYTSRLYNYENVQPKTPSKIFFCVSTCNKATLTTIRRNTSTMSTTNYVSSFVFSFVGSHTHESFFFSFKNCTKIFIVKKITISQSIIFYCSIRIPCIMYLKTHCSYKRNNGGSILDPELA